VAGIAMLQISSDDPVIQASTATSLQRRVSLPGSKQERTRVDSKEHVPLALVPNTTTTGLGLEEPK
jgi:hypothetical protein